MASNISKYSDNEKQRQKNIVEQLVNDYKNIEPYDVDEMPDEIHSWEEFDRCMATMLPDLKEMVKDY